MSDNKENKIKIVNAVTAKEDILSVIVSVNRYFDLFDRRIRSNGIYFGTVEDVARNLGVTLKETESGLMASAPKTRLQKFVERLHFSGVPYGGA
jgi:hypothetical protein